MRGKTLVAIAALVFSLYYMNHLEPKVAKYFLYPNDYSEEVFSASKREGVDQHLIEAVILAESRYYSNAASKVGAIGLMQLMPDTAHWIVSERNLANITEEDLKDPALNIDMGTWYLAYLLKEFKGNQILALAAYNAGRGNVESWMEEKGWDYHFSDIQAIPFPETREYVKKVLEYKMKYRTLYEEGKN